MGHAVRFYGDSIITHFSYFSVCETAIDLRVFSKILAVGVHFDKDRRLHSIFLEDRERVQIIARKAIIKSQNDRLGRKRLRAVLESDKIIERNGRVAFATEIVHLFVKRRIVAKIDRKS